MTLKIAFVMPWYGPDIPGGAEAEARRTMLRLIEAGVEIEVLTTCIKDFHSDWRRNYHKPGVSSEQGVTVRRFPIEPGDKDIFDHVNGRLMANARISEEEENQYINEMFRAPELWSYMRTHQQAYIYFFIPYMFPTTYYGAQVAPQRSVIIPCLHDESYAYLTLYKRALPQARVMILHTQAEVDLAAKIFGPAGKYQERLLLGEGVDTDFVANGDAFRQKYGLNGRLILYVGRRDVTKNVPLLVDYWTRYVRQSQSKIDAKLVLVGSGSVPIPEEMRGHIIDLGFVSTQDKFDAYAAADIYCHPSLNESFSIVTMESMLAETPVLVHGQCAVTREHCLRSNGGLYFSNYAEFVATLEYLFTHPAEARQMGRNGREYVLANYQWDIIIERYLKLIARLQQELAL